MKNIAIFTILACLSATTVMFRQASRIVGLEKQLECCTLTLDEFIHTREDSLTEQYGLMGWKPEYVQTIDPVMLFTIVGVDTLIPGHVVCDTLPDGILRFRSATISDARRLGWIK